DFAAFVLLADRDGRDRLRAYYAPYLEIAAARGTGFLLGTPTWRASADWGARLGYSDAQLADVNREAAALLCNLREWHQARGPVLVEGIVGPRGDGYVVGEAMTAEQAEAYHLPQLEALAEGGADLACALTLTYAEEGIGIVRAARRAGLPAAIFFTVETDGRLPSGQPLRQAIELVDAATGAAAAYYGINCAHPSHFQ